ncbi:MAG: hypothetical protein ACR2PR_07230, partial [Pseudohongiellaceae bacterium]
FSHLNSEITEVLIPTSDIRKGDTLAYAPKFQANIRLRYEWPTSNNLTAYLMPDISHSSESYSDILAFNRDKINNWLILGLSTGLQASNWTAELYLDNLTNEAAELSRNFVNDIQRATYTQPRTIGLRFSYEL